MKPEVEKRMKTRTIAALALGGVAIGATAWGVSAAANTSTPNSSSAAVIYAPEGPVPAEAEAQLAAVGIDLETPAANRAADGKPDVILPALTSRRATDLARVEFALPGDTTPVAVSLTEMTTPGYGRELESDTKKPSRIDPMYVDQLAWAVTFENAPHPERGPLPQAGVERAGADTDTRGTMVVMIDAVSGEFLYAMSY